MLRTAVLRPSHPSLAVPRHRRPPAPARTDATPGLVKWGPWQTSDLSGRCPGHLRKRRFRRADGLDELHRLVHVELRHSPSGATPLPHLPLGTPTLAYTPHQFHQLFWTTCSSSVRATVCTLGPCLRRGLRGRRRGAARAMKCGQLAAASGASGVDSSGSAAGRYFPCTRRRYASEASMVLV